MSNECVGGANACMQNSRKKSNTRDASMQVVKEVDFSTMYVDLNETYLHSDTQFTVLCHSLHQS